MNKRHLSKAHAAAYASPSIGWYLATSGLLNLLVAKTVYHPDWQQLGRRDWQLQFFCTNQHPTADFDQSVANTVGALSSKLFTPFSHCLITSSFDFSNATLSSSDQKKGSLVDSNFLNGSITGADAKA